MGNRNEHVAGNDGKRHPIRCYDNGETADRYTVIYMSEQERSGLYSAVGMSGNPFHPQGFGQHTRAAPGSHLGKRVKFIDLPEDCRRLVMQDINAASAEIQAPGVAAAR